MKLVDYLIEVQNFIKDYLENNHMDKIVLGLSGGVDSSLVAALTRKAVGKDRLMCIMMPIASNPADLEDAKAVAEALDVNYLVVDGTDTFEAAKKAFALTGVEFDKATLSNLKVRIRMCYLFAYAQKCKGLVIGTDNMDEKYTGYFTKYGDGAADLLPIVYLTKAEVVEAAKMLGVPERLAHRTPTAGLFEGQTDETEMGVTYADLDAFLLGKKVPAEVEARIAHLHKVSQHKRDPIPTPKEYIRD